MKIARSNCVFVICIICVSTIQFTHQDPLGGRPIVSKFHVSKIRREVGQDAVIFPEEKLTGDSDSEPAQRRKRDVEFNRFAREPCPNNTLFCDTVDNYPEDQIKKLLKQQPIVLEQFFTEDELDYKGIDRFGDNPETQLCDSRATLIHPKKAKSSENVFEFVVNDDEHRQGVRIEVCKNKGNDCDVIGSILPFGYKSQCVQKYVTRSLVIAEYNSGGISGFVTKPFMIPSCCSCSLLVYHTVDPLERFGGGSGIPSGSKPSRK